MRISSRVGVLSGSSDRTAPAAGTSAGAVRQSRNAVEISAVSRIRARLSRLRVRRRLLQSNPGWGCGKLTAEDILTVRQPCR
jgi:hypothetical protein